MPGQSALVTQRKETDTVKILSGVFEGHTLGTPISLSIPNQDMRPGDYREVQQKYRPSHADYTYDAKYGFRDYRGGGRSSARETVVRVVAGAIAKKLLAVAFEGRVVGYVTQIGDVVASVGDPAGVTLEEVETLPDGTPNLVRCPDAGAAARMVELVERMRKEQDLSLIHI